MEQPRTIAELAALPGAADVMKKLGIDYGKQGDQSMREACRAAGVTTKELLNLIDLRNRRGNA